MIRKTPDEHPHADHQTGERVRRTPEEIQDWIVTFLAAELRRTPESIDVTVPLDMQCVDSVAAVGMTGKLEDWLGKRIDPTVIFDYPTIEALSGYLAADDEE